VELSFWSGHWSTVSARALHVSGRWPDQRTAPSRPCSVVGAQPASPPHHSLSASATRYSDHARIQSISARPPYLCPSRTSDPSPRSTPLLCAAAGLQRHGRGHAAPGPRHRRLAASRLRGFRPVRVPREASPHLQLQVRARTGPSPTSSLATGAGGRSPREAARQVLDPFPALFHHGSERAIGSSLQLGGAAC